MQTVSNPNLIVVFPEPTQSSINRIAPSNLWSNQKYTTHTIFQTGWAGDRPPRPHTGSTPRLQVWSQQANINVPKRGTKRSQPLKPHAQQFRQTLCFQHAFFLWRSTATTLSNCNFCLTRGATCVEANAMKLGSHLNRHSLHGWETSRHTHATYYSRAFQTPTPFNL